MKKGKNINFWLIVINILVYLLEVLFGESSIFLFGLVPSLAVKGFVWQFLTYMFLHSLSDPFHLIINMFVLFMFGPHVESAMGSKKFLTFYLICGIGSSLFYIILTGISSIPLIGASGAIFGVLTAFGIMFPEVTIFVMGIFPMPARIAVIFFGIIELIYGLSGFQPNIANFGHLGGMVVGFLLIKFFGFGKRKVRYVWEY
jgi:membrane associated rhomboid family serine protease